MTLKEQFGKAFNTLTDSNIQSSRKIQGGSTINTSNMKEIRTSGMDASTYSGSSYSGSSQFGHAFNQPAFNQPSFGSNSGSFTNKPSHPFEFLDSIEKAKLIKAFLIERGVNTINEETAKALFLVSCELKDQVLPPVKQAKKKLII